MKPHQRIISAGLETLVYYFQTGEEARLAAASLGGRVGAQFLRESNWVAPFRVTVIRPFDGIGNLS